MLLALVVAYGVGERLPALLIAGSDHSQHLLHFELVRRILPRYSRFC